MPEEPEDLQSASVEGIDAPETEPDNKSKTRVSYRGERSDPLFGYLIAIALSIGLAPLLSAQPPQPDLRYTVSWGAMAGFGVLAWLLGSSERIEREPPGDLAWGITFGLILAAPLLAFGSGVLATTVDLLFGQMTIGTLLTYLIFVMPLAETLFFRGVFQQNRPFWFVGLLASLWSALLYFPMLDIRGFPGPTIVIAVALVMMNIMYSYVRDRNGLAAAWLCQITVNLVLLVLPFLTS